MRIRPVSNPEIRAIHNNPDAIWVVVFNQINKSVTVLIQKFGKRRRVAKLSILLNSTTRLRIALGLVEHPAKRFEEQAPHRTRR